VIIADDDPVFLEALADLVASVPELEMVGAATDAEEAIKLASAVHPAAAVIDVRMPQGGGPRAARGILECSPQTMVIAYSAHDDRGIVLDMLRAGATGYLVKGASADEVIDKLLHVARGEAVLSPEVAGGVVDELTLQMEQHDHEREARRTLRRRIQETIDRRRFNCVFQPIVDLSSGQAVGVEALSRFSGEPLQGAEQWFADAQRVNLGLELELAIAGAALEEVDALPEGAFLSVNLSPSSLASAYPLVADAGPRRLVIEVTEHAVINDYEALRPHIAKLRAAGGRLAVDDAGAGFASLRHTLQLAPEFLKLDISLTRGIDHDPGRRALAVGLIGFAGELGSEIIAEGIETREELDALRSLGMRRGQGLYLAPPGPFAEAWP
jgi:EAL domain-containing protein (putative c-di-GMP-specific phosphodiesterase class I)